MRVDEKTINPFTIYNVLLHDNEIVVTIKKKLESNQMDEKKLNV